MVSELNRVYCEFGHTEYSLVELVTFTENKL